MENKKALTKSVKLQGFIVSLIILLLLIGLGVIYILPKLSEIKTAKAELDTLVDQKKEISIKGLGFNEFRGLGKKVAKDTYTVSFIENLEKEFFDRHFINNDNAVTYDQFLDNKAENVAALQSSDKFSDQKKTVSDILPIYGVSSEFINDNQTNISDYEFINYLESLLNRFYLTSTDAIGIATMEQIKSETGDDTQQNNNIEEKFESNYIYSIPVELTVTGNKGNILAFIHYLEKLGEITIENGEIVPYIDHNLDEYFSKDEHIYSKGLSTIQSITFDEYIDSNPKNTNKSKKATLEKFYQYMTEGVQKNEEITVTLSILFYVSGVDTIKYISDINTISQSLEDKEKEINKLIEEKQSGDDIKENVSQINVLNSQLKLIENLKEDIELLRVEASNANVDEGYPILSRIQNQLDSINNK